MKQTLQRIYAQPRLRLNIDGRPINSELLPPRTKNANRAEKAERNKQN